MRGDRGSHIGLDFWLISSFFIVSFSITLCSQLHKTISHIKSRLLLSAICYQISPSFYSQVANKTVPALVFFNEVSVLIGVDMSLSLSNTIS